MKCGECKFWGVNVKEPWETEPQTQTGEWRQCGRIPMEADYGDPPTKHELAVVKDGSNYFAALKSRADFGCVLFQQKGAE